jgi:hypothetical protein
MKFFCSKIEFIEYFCGNFYGCILTYMRVFLILDGVFRKRRKDLHIFMNSYI